MFEWFRSFYKSVVDWLNTTPPLPDFDEDFFKEPKLLGDEDINRAIMSQSMPNLHLLDLDAEYSDYKDARSTKSNEI
tara:strand:- start:2203 stop:2433 length:231 start_codon:yes stop_codon:yes gene_type:complete